jgi:hypothetical protein
VKALIALLTVALVLIIVFRASLESPVRRVEAGSSRAGRKDQLVVKVQFGPLRGGRRAAAALRMA